MTEISVIIPTYNRSRYVGLTLESFYHQNFDKNKFEIIVSDNNSSDNTREIINEFINSHTDLSVKYLYEGRQGVHYARNSAAKISRGEYLYFTDDDMIADENLLKELLYLFHYDHKVASATGLVLPKWEVEPPSWVLKLCNNYLLSLNDPDYDFMISEVDCNVFSCHQMIKREIFFMSGGFNPENTDGKWIGDGETGLNMKIKELGYKFAFNRKSVIYHMIPQKRLTQRYLNKRLINQGNSDSYTYYRANLPSFGRLVLEMIKYIFYSFISFGKFLINRILNTESWRINLSKCYYYPARINYNLKLILSPSWRRLVIKNNWLED